MTSPTRSTAPWSLSRRVTLTLVSASGAGGMEPENGSWDGPKNRRPEPECDGASGANEGRRAPSAPPWPWLLVLRRALSVTGDLGWLRLLFVARLRDFRVLLPLPHNPSSHGLFYLFANIAQVPTPRLRRLRRPSSRVPSRSTTLSTRSVSSRPPSTRRSVNLSSHMDVTNIAVVPHLP